MGNLAYQAAFRKQQKKSYKGLSEEQRKYIKAKELYEQMEKDLSYFYSHCNHTLNGAVDFEHMAEKELDNFEYLNKRKESAMRKMSKLEDIIDVSYTLNVFLQMNTHSMSF